MPNEYDEVHNELPHSRHNFDEAAKADLGITLGDSVDENGTACSGMTIKTSNISPPRQTTPSTKSRSSSSASRSFDDYPAFQNAGCDAALAAWKVSPRRAACDDVPSIPPEIMRTQQEFASDGWWTFQPGKDDHNTTDSATSSSKIFISPPRSPLWRRPRSKHRQSDALKSNGLLGTSGSFDDFDDVGAASPRSAQTTTTVKENAAEHDNSAAQEATNALHVQVDFLIGHNSPLRKKSQTLSGAGSPQPLPSPSLGMSPSKSYASTLPSSILFPNPPPSPVRISSQRGAELFKSSKGEGNRRPSLRSRLPSSRIQKLRIEGQQNSQKEPAVDPKVISQFHQLQIEIARTDHEEKIKKLMKKRADRNRDVIQYTTLLKQLDDIKRKAEIEQKNVVPTDKKSRKFALRHVNSWFVNFQAFDEMDDDEQFQSLLKPEQLAETEAKKKKFSFIPVVERRKEKTNGISPESYRQKSEKQRGAHSNRAKRSTIKDLPTRKVRRNFASSFRHQSTGQRASLSVLAEDDSGQGSEGIETDDERYSQLSEDVDGEQIDETQNFLLPVEEERLNLPDIEGRTIPDDESSTSDHSEGFGLESSGSFEEIYRYGELRDDTSPNLARRVHLSPRRASRPLPDDA